MVFGFKRNWCHWKIYFSYVFKWRSLYWRTVWACQVHLVLVVTEHVCICVLVLRLAVPRLFTYDSFLSFCHHYPIPDFSILPIFYLPAGWRWLSYYPLLLRYKIYHGFYGPCRWPPSGPTQCVQPLWWTRCATLAPIATSFSTPEPQWSLWAAWTWERGVQPGCWREETALSGESEAAKRRGSDVVWPPGDWWKSEVKISRGR